MTSAFQMKSNHKLSTPLDKNTIQTYEELYRTLDINAEFNNLIKPQQSPNSNSNLFQKKYIK